MRYVVCWLAQSHAALAAKLAYAHDVDVVFGMLPVRLWQTVGLGIWQLTFLVAIWGFGTHIQRWPVGLWAGLHNAPPLGFRHSNISQVLQNS